MFRTEYSTAEAATESVQSATTPAYAWSNARFRPESLHVTHAQRSYAKQRPKPCIPARPAIPRLIPTPTTNECPITANRHVPIRQSRP
jgi:hypothetical protein